MEENIEAKLERMNKIKGIEERYNKRKNWILGLTLAAIVGGSWYGSRSLNYAEQMEFLNPYADRSIESLIAKTASNYLAVERKRLFKIKQMVEKTESDIAWDYNIEPKIYFKELEEKVEEEFKFANNDFIREEQKSKNTAFYLDKAKEWNKEIRQNMRIGTAIYSANIAITFIAGILLILNCIKKENKVKPYLNQHATTPS